MVISHQIHGLISLRLAVSSLFLVLSASVPEENYKTWELQQFFHNRVVTSLGAKARCILREHCAELSQPRYLEIYHPAPDIFGIK